MNEGGMARTQINPQEVVNDILSGTDDISLMEKYGLSSKGLASLVNKLVDSGLLRQSDSRRRPPDTPRKISARQIVRDIASGMSESELMKKYGLSQRRLREVCRRLLEARDRSRKEFQEAIPVDESTLVEANIRQLQRYYPDFDLPIYEAGNPEIQGRVRDITEEGIGVLGIHSTVYEIKTFVVLGDPFGEVGPFEFDAECRWAKDLGGGVGHAAGFKIARIQKQDRALLGKLIELIAFRA
jgi:hypothetical protein